MSHKSAINGNGNYIQDYLVQSESTHFYLKQIKQFDVAPGFSVELDVYLLMLPPFCTLLSIPVAITGT